MNDIDYNRIILFNDYAQLESYYYYLDNNGFIRKEHLYPDLFEKLFVAKDLMKLSFQMAGNKPFESFDNPFSSYVNTRFFNSEYFDICKICYDKVIVKLNDNFFSRIKATDFKRNNLGTLDKEHYITAREIELSKDSITLDDKILSEILRKNKERLDNRKIVLGTVTSSFRDLKFTDFYDSFGTPYTFSSIEHDIFGAEEYLKETEACTNFLVNNPKTIKLGSLFIDEEFLINNTLIDSEEKLKIISKDNEIIEYEFPGIFNLKKKLMTIIETRNLSKYSEFPRWMLHLETNFKDKIETDNFFDV